MLDQDYFSFGDISINKLIGLDGNLLLKYFFMDTIGESKRQNLNRINIDGGKLGVKNKCKNFIILF